ncbi:hypothetical protein EYV94_03280 [Puteibacter caeruleilacunae]|nr:hypothetical protein EYV94_03280 [Puteibacter caeruleilacunae]
MTVKVVAQPPYIATSGTTSTVFVNQLSTGEHDPDHVGNLYAWSLYSVTNWTDEYNTNPADPSAYSFVDGDNTNKAEIAWHMPGRYYLMVEETNASDGCSTRRIYPVEVQDEMHYALTEGITDCAGARATFELPVTLTQNGSPLAERHFPVTMQYTINGNTFTTDPIPYSSYNTSEGTLMLNVTAHITINDDAAEYQVDVIRATNAAGVDMINKVSQQTITIHAKPVLSPISLNAGK